MQANHVTPESFHYAIYKISRDYDGIKLEETNFPEDEQNNIISKYHQGTPLGDYLAVNSHDGMIDIIMFIGINEYAKMGVLTYDVSVHRELQDFLFHIKWLANKLQYKEYRNLELPRVEDSIAFLSQFSAVDSILFVLYTNQPLFVLGNHIEIFTVFLHFLNLLPEFYLNHLSFHTFTQDITSMYKWHGMPSTQKSLQRIADLSEDPMIIVPATKKSSAPYSCNIVRDLVKKLENTGFMSCEAYESVLEELFANVKQIHDADSVEAIADTLSITIDDAEFYQAIKLNVFRNSGNQDFTLNLCKKIPREF